MKKQTDLETKQKIFRFQLGLAWKALGELLNEAVEQTGFSKRTPKEIVPYEIPEWAIGPNQALGRMVWIPVEIRSIQYHDEGNPRQILVRSHGISDPLFYVTPDKIYVPVGDSDS